MAYDQQLADAIAENARLRAENERLVTASKAAFDALEDGDGADAHLILQTLFRNRALAEELLAFIERNVQEERERCAQIVRSLIMDEKTREHVTLAIEIGATMEPVGADGQQAPAPENP